MYEKKDSDNVSKGDDDNKTDVVVIVVVACHRYCEQLKSKHSWMDRKIKFSKYTPSYYHNQNKNIPILLFEVPRH